MKFAKNENLFCKKRFFLFLSVEFPVIINCNNISPRKELLSMKRILCILLCLLVLSPLATAAKDESLAGQLYNYMYNNGLSEENFAISYFNVTSGASYHFNENAFFHAGDVWTLPLHMYYCLEEYRGSFLPEKNDPDYQNPDYVYTIKGLSLDNCRTQSILGGDQKILDAMRDEIMQYNEVINEEFGHIQDKDLSELYYTENCYSTKFLMNCLIELERTSEIYGELMRLYDMSQSHEGFYSADQPLTNKYRTVQIRGEEKGMVCAVAEVSAPDTYLLACFVSEEAGGDRVLAEVNALVCAYVQSVSKNTSGANNNSSTVGMVRTDNSFKVIAENPNDLSGVFKWILIGLGGAAVLVVMAFACDRIIRKIRRRQK